MAESIVWQGVEGLADGSGIDYCAIEVIEVCLFSISSCLDTPDYGLRISCDC